MAPDSDQWQISLVAVMNLQYHKNGDTFVQLS